MDCWPCEPIINWCAGVAPALLLKNAPNNLDQRDFRLLQTRFGPYLDALDSSCYP